MISYSAFGEGGGEGEGDGQGDGQGHGGGGKGVVNLGIDKRRLKQMMQSWGLSFSKPGKKTKKLYKLLIAENGVDENQEKTIEAMLERHMATGYFKEHGFKVNVTDEDMRYNLIQEKELPNLSATFVIMRDVSGSMSSYGEFSATIAGLIEFWLRQRYNNVVNIRYIAHTTDAVEMDSKKSQDFFKLVAGGGTYFQPAYQMVLDMMDGKHYNSISASRGKIEYESEDVFLLHITDGDTGDNGEELYSTLKTLFPRLTKAFYLQVDTYSDQFYKAFVSMGGEKANAVKSGNDVSYKNVKKVLDSLLN